MQLEPAWPPDFYAWNPETWEAFGTCVTAIVAIAAAIFAWRQVREAARLRKEQAEPYVAVSLESSLASQQFADLVIRNYGATAAYDVKVAITPVPRRSSGSGQGVEDVHIPEILRTLVPGQEWRSFWDSAADRTKADLPDLHEATVTFYSKTGGGRRRKHVLEYQLDFGSRKDTQYIRVLGMHDAAKALRDVAKEMHSWSERVSSRGLSVYTRDGDARDQRLREAALEERRQREAGQSRADSSDESHSQN